MKKKRQKGFPLVIIIAVFIVIIALIIINIVSKKSEENQAVSNNEDNYSQVASDGSRVNLSDKLKEDKKFDDLDINNIELKSNGQITQLTATINNNTGKTKGGYPAKIILVDSNNNKVAEMGIYIKELKAGETTKLNSSITFDYTNVYNFIIQK